MKKTVLILSLLFCFSYPGPVYAEQPMPDCKCRPTFGNYCQGPRWGWYGAKRMIKSPAEAIDALHHMYADLPDTKIGRITEKPRFFEAEILDKNGNLIDLVIIDKKSGRIRSIF